MSEIEDIADTEFDELLEHVDLGELDVVELRTESQDMSKELLDFVLVPADDTLSLRRWHTRDGRCGNCVRKWTRAKGPFLLFPTCDV